ncbi:hypothetical protein BaRGS_00023359 [Batillaria attramentaria]|uniref:RNA helicase n=1 Tax=Batillaria attramentaria TaxID=370345 RepID=A0ABD0KE36_9CAEN
MDGDQEPRADRPLPRPRTKKFATTNTTMPEKKQKEQETQLFVRVHDVISNVRVLGDVLTAKVNTEGVEFTPTETDVKRSDTFTYCTLTCPSKALAKRLRYLLLKDRQRFRPLIDCSFTEFDQEDVIQRRFKHKREELKQRFQTELDTRSEEVLRKHNQRLEDVVQKIDAARQRLNDLYVYKQTKEEITALEHKQVELQKQKQEFLKAVDGYRHRLVAIGNNKSFERDIQALRKGFGVECCRLEKHLPMYARKQDIIDLVKNNQVSIILAETGSGKSTQVVQYLLETDVAERGTIVCTQPRKVAAVSLATHVAKELATNVGKEVGYKVGSKCKRSDSTKVVFMTDHALLNECLADPSLSGFSCIVVDEAHERSLYTDLLLGMIKRCMKKRPELRVIITSATIDPEVFVQFFGGDCPIMNVSGRTFPVEVVWQDADSEENDFENYVDEAVKKAVEIHTKEPKGDILVFLTSPAEIDKCCEFFQETLKDHTDFQCFPLHGQLQPDEQQKVFEPLGKNKRKIVFATNCAETSITIDGIKYVVDTGVAKEMRYDAKKNVNSLSVTIISRSSADQRKGRAGRTAPGKCYRLYSQRSYNDMDAISLPEILKTHLGQALLKLAELGIGPDMYDFVQSPSPDAISAALETLVQLGAMENGKITETGRWMARLPFDPKLGLLTLLGKNNDVLFDSVVLAAVMNAGSAIFYRGTTPEDHTKLDKAKAKFSHSGGDCLTSLKLYKEWQEVPEKQKNKWCVDNSVNAKVIRGVRDVVNEVSLVLKRDAGIEVSHTFSEVESVSDLLRRLIFQCYFTNLCHFLGHEKAGFFAATACRQVHFHPSSAMNALASFPEWVVYHQLMKTSRDFITGITPVDGNWLADIKKAKLGFDIEEIRNKKVQKIYSQPVGTHAFFQLVGPRYSKMREYEERFSGDTSDVLVLEASREMGEVRVLSTDAADSLKGLTDMLASTVKTAVEELEADDKEVPVGKDDSRLRVVLGAGGQVIETLMPTESRKVFVTHPSSDADEESILQKFRHFGTIRFLYQFPKGDRWGFLIFKTAKQARAAEEGTKDDESDIGQVEFRPPVRQNAEFKARLSWCRRPSRGFGFAEVSPAYLSSCLVKGSFCVDGSLITIQKDKKRENSLYLKGLPSVVSEDVIKRSLLHELGQKEDAKGVVYNVTVSRQRIGPTDNNELRRLERQITAHFEARLVASRVQVTVRKPKGEQTATFLAEACFSDPIEGFAACRALRGNFVLNSQAVDIEPILLSTITVRERVMETCKAQYEEAVRELTDRGIEITCRQLRNNNFLVSIKAMDLEDVVRGRAFLNDVFKGDVLDCIADPNMQHLLTAAGRKFLQEAEKDTGAYVCVDNRLRTIAIHGSDRVRTQVRLKMKEYLDLVLSGTVEDVTLKGSDNPPGLLKALITKHGDDLDGLRSDLGLHSVTVDYRRHKLKLTGTPDKIQKAKDQIQATKNQLWATSKEAKPEEDDIECPACFCPIEISELYRLEICAHPYCRGCLKHQVTSAIKDRSLPVVCCQEGCGRPLAWRDFNNLVRVGDIKLTDLTTAAVTAFVLANRHVARFCTTPDCPMLYRVSTEDKAEVFQCPECGVRTCTACHAQSHDGITCAMLRDTKDEAKGVEAWASQDRNRRRACPGCGSPIEKIGGCNRMNCSACKTIFCWPCGAKFATEKACYDHLAKNHDGIFDPNNL